MLHYFSKSSRARVKKLLILRQNVLKYRCCLSSRNRLVEWRSYPLSAKRTRRRKLRKSHPSRRKPSMVSATFFERLVGESNVCHLREKCLSFLLCLSLFRSERNMQFSSTTGLGVLSINIDSIFVGNNGNQEALNSSTEEATSPSGKRKVSFEFLPFFSSIKFEISPKSRLCQSLKYSVT